MTMTNTAPKVAYTGNGVTTSFAVPFQFFGSDEIEVIERTIATGAEATKTLSTHYTVSGGNGSTGTVTAVSAPASTVEWHIRRKTKRTQTTDYVDGEALPSATLEKDFDRVVALALELEQDLARAILLPKTDAAADLILPTTDDRASKYLGFDENGDITVTEGTSGPQGPTGPAGADGADGADGSVWHTGSSDPSSGTGVDGDYYIQTGTGSTGVLGDVWRKASGTWSIIGNIRGATGATGATGADGSAGAAGADGADGATWYDGETDPDNGNGADGDYYLQTDAGSSGVIGDVWAKAAGVWAIVGNIRGATGAAGSGSGDMVAANNLSDVVSVSSARDNLGLGDLAVKDTVAEADIDNNAVTDAKLRQSAGLSVVGRSANSTGNVADITAGTDGHVLRRSGTAVGFGTVANAGLADMVQATIKGRAAAAGTGAVTDLTASQVATILAGSDVDPKGLHTISVPAAAMTARTTSGAASGTSESSTNKVMTVTLDFDAGTDEFAQFQIAMPKGWNESTVTAQFIWTAGNTGNVVWGIQGVAHSDDDALDAAFGTAQTVTDGVTAAGDVMISAATDAVTIAGTPAEGDLVTFQVYRDADNGSDTLAVDAKLIAVRLLYTTNAATDA
jgi:hypothetical protein